MHGGRDGATTDAQVHGGEPTAGETPEERAGRLAELRRAAAEKGSELGRTAASKSADLGQIAATTGSELGRRSADLARTMRSLDVPWVRARPARVAREAILQFGLSPMIDWYTRARVHGRHSLRDLPHPVVLVANHSSHLDTPAILRALPLRWRQRTAVVAAADYFYKNRTVANAVALVFNTVPLLRRGGGGLRQGSTEHVDRLLEQRWNILMYPEGTRSRDGRLGRLKSGAAVIARQHGVPIVPVRVRGTHDAMPPGQNWPRRLRGTLLQRRHRVEIHFGPPIWPGDGEQSRDVMERVRGFLDADLRGRRDGAGSRKDGAGSRKDGAGSRKDGAGGRKDADVRGRKDGGGGRFERRESATADRLPEPVVPPS